MEGWERAWPGPLGPEGVMAGAAQPHWPQDPPPQPPAYTATHTVSGLSCQRPHHYGLLQLGAIPEAPGR